MNRKNGSFKQFIFGKTVILKAPLSPEDAGKIISKAKYIKERLPLPPQDKILDVFDRLARAWQDRSYSKRRNAFRLLVKATGFSRELIGVVLDEFPKLLSSDYLLKKIEGDLGNRFIQEAPVKQKATNAALIARPAGIVLHVASGNVFLACIESIIDGIITKNVNILKMSSAEREFPILFAESLKEFDRDGIITGRLGILWWPGGYAPVEGLFKRGADRIVFWGGGEALSSWKKGTGEFTEVISHGPKTSFGIVSKKGAESFNAGDLTRRIALDVAIWDQKACNSPQILFVENTLSDRNMQRFIYALTKSFEVVRERFPAGKRSDDEHVEILKTRELALAGRFATGKPVTVYGPDSFDWTIISGEKTVDHTFGASPLNRTLFVRRYKSAGMLADSLKEYSDFLQTAGYCLDREEVPLYAEALSKAGVTRLCPFGSMAIVPPGNPHDGTYALRNLTRFTAVE